MKSGTSIVLTLLTLVGIGFAAWRWRSGAGHAELHYETATVDRGRIIAKITANGTLSALVTVQVGSQVSGRLAEVLVDFNSQVKKGQVLAKIDPQLFDAALAEAKASVVIAEGNLAKAQVQSLDAKRQFERLSLLFEQKVVNQSDRDTAETTAKSDEAMVRVAEGNLAQAKAALVQSEVNLGYTTIVSPIDGSVISRNVDAGQTVAASLSAPTLFTIAEDLRKMQVDTSVAEGDVGKLQPGMTVSFSVDAYPGEHFSGSVRQIRNSPQVSQNVVTYDAVIDVENPELKLKPGMTANATFIYAEKDDALRVPNAALRFRPPPELVRPGEASGDKAAAAPAAAAEGGGKGRKGHGQGDKPPSNKRTVWVLRASEPVAVAIKVGITDGTTSEVADGELHEGDLVITDSIGSAAPAAAAGPGGRRIF